MGRFQTELTCLDCGKVQRVRNRELIRARRPRCTACGGPVQESKAAREGHAAHADMAKTIGKTTYRRDGKGRAV